MEKNAPHQLQNGTILQERYQIDKVIGQGGFGITYMGMDTRLNMKIAVKEYFPNGLVNRNAEVTNEVSVNGSEQSRNIYEEGKVKFLDEARILAQFVSESGVVCVRDFFETNETAYIVMEYVEGQNLNRYLKEVGKISYTQAIQMVTPVLQVLDKIHAKGLIHRDISPANIILQPDGKVKLLDFGAARSYSTEQDLSYSIMLKQGYAPAEQYHTKGKQGPWSDVYSMAATIYKMITGSVPEESMNRVFQDDLILPSKLGADILQWQENALLQGLAVKVEDRVQNMGQFLQLLTNEGASDDSAVGESDSAITAQEVTDSQSIESTDNNDELTWMGDDSEAILERSRASKSQTQNDSLVQPDKEIADVPDQNEKSDEKNDSKKKKLTKDEKKTLIKEKREAKKRKGGKGKGRAIKVLKIIGIIVAAIIVLSIIKTTFWDNPYENNGYVVLSNENVTESMMRKAIRGKKVQTIYLNKCTLSQKCIEILSKSNSIEKVELSSCKGFTSLDSLSKMMKLKHLQVDGASDEKINVGQYISVDFPNVTILYIHYNDLNGDATVFTHFPNTKYLNICGCEGIDDGSFFKCMPELESIEMNRAVITQGVFDGIANCKKLKRIHANETGISSLSALKGITSLESVEVNDNNLSSLDGIQDSMVHTLYAENNSITDISALEGNTELSYVHLNSNKISDIAPLINCEKIASLELNDNQITDISALSNKTELRYLYIDNNSVEDFGPLKDSLDFTSLNASNNKMQNLDFCSEMTRLKRIYISNNNITDINGLKAASQLEEIDMSHNQITDISVFANLDDKLKVLKVNDNQISDISALSGSTNLSAVMLENNNISDISPLSGNTMLSVVSLGNNQITTLKSLSEIKEIMYISVNDNKLTSLEGLEGSTQISYLDASRNQLTDISGIRNNMADNVAYAFEHNQIADIDVLSVNKKIDFVSLYDNPVTDFSAMDVSDDTRKIGAFYVTVTDMSDTLVEQLANAGFEKNLYVVDMPVENQGAFRSHYDDASKARQKRQGGLPIEPEFKTTSEADTELQKYRDEITDNTMRLYWMSEVKKEMED